MKRFLKFFMLSWIIIASVSVSIMFIAMIIDGSGIEFIKDSLKIVIAMPIIVSSIFATLAAIITGKCGDKIERWLMS